MNEAIAAAARRRNAGLGGDPALRSRRAAVPARLHPDQSVRLDRTRRPRSPTCCSSRPAAARPRPILASPPSPSRPSPPRLRPAGASSVTAQGTPDARSAARLGRRCALNWRGPAQHRRQPKLLGDWPSESDAGPLDACPIAGAAPATRNTRRAREPLSQRPGQAGAGASHNRP